MPINTPEKNPIKENKITKKKRKKTMWGAAVFSGEIVHKLSITAMQVNTSFFSRSSNLKKLINVLTCNKVFGKSWTEGLTFVNCFKRLLEIFRMGYAAILMRLLNWLVLNMNLQIGIHIFEKKKITQGYCSVNLKLSTHKQSITKKKHNQVDLSQVQPSFFCRAL